MLVIFVDLATGNVLFSVALDRVPGVGEVCDFHGDGLWRVRAVMSGYRKGKYGNYQSAKVFHLSAERVETEATPPKKEN